MRLEENVSFALLWVCIIPIAVFKMVGVAFYYVVDKAKHQYRGLRLWDWLEIYGQK